MEKEQAYFRKQMQGLLPLNLGALFMPPIWGPAHGIWITILFYPLWLFADNLFYAAFTEPTTLTVVCAVLVFIGSVVVTVLFAWVGQRYALRRALTMGKTKEEYQKKQRIWAICMALVAIIFIGQVAMVELPGLQQFFNVCGLNLQDWIIIIIGSSLVLWVRELWHLLTKSSSCSTNEKASK